MSFTTKEIRESIDRYDEFAYRIENSTVNLDIGTATYVDGELPGYGVGEDIWLVFELDGKHYRLTGYYDSSDGPDWTEGYGSTLREVTVEKETVVVYKFTDVDASKTIPAAPTVAPGYDEDMW